MSTIRTDGYSRRTFLRVAGGALGGAWLTLDLTKVAQAAHDAHVAQQSPGTPTTSFLSKAELAVLLGQLGSELADRDAMSLVNLNAAVPVNAAVAANVLSDGSIAGAAASQTGAIDQAT